MSDAQVYGLVVLGVITAVLFPTISAALRKYFPQTQAGGISPWVKKYIVLAIFGVVTGLVVFAYFKHEHPGPVTAWYEPFLAGFSWQSTIDAIFRPKPRGSGGLPKAA